MTAKFELYPDRLDLILHGRQSVKQKQIQAEKIKAAWQANIHNITGATKASIRVEERGFEVAVVADDDVNDQSAWFYLEYGTSKMRAQHPGRRAIRGF